MTEERAAYAAPEFTPKDFLQHVPPIGTWAEWFKLAQAATTFEQKLGLLHVGFDVEVQANGKKAIPGKPTSTDRLKFYFGVADGWTNASHFRYEGLLWSDEESYFVGRDKHHNALKRTVSEQRHLLARKAFDMLARNYLRPMLEWLKEANHRDHGEDAWVRRFLFDPAFLMIQEFFAIENGGVRNLSGPYCDRSPSEDLAVEFLLKLPKLLWSWQEDEIESYDSAETKAQKERDNPVARQVVAAAKLWIIEVLAELRKLDLLKPWLINGFDESCVTKLKEIALRRALMQNFHHVLKDRRAATIDEACFAGSEAAWLLKQRELMVRESDRLQAIRHAQRERDNADERVRKLTGGQPA